MFLSIRHCERCEAIQSRLWIAAWLVLAMLFPRMAGATSCEKILSLPQSIGDADAVFEGHYLEYDMLWVKCDTQDCKESMEGNGYYIVATTYAVDKMWRGDDAMKKATILSSWPIPAHMEQAFRDEAESYAKLKAKKVFALKEFKETAKLLPESEGKNPEDYGRFYFDPVCGGEYEQSQENTQILEKRFPKVPVQ